MNPREDEDLIEQWLSGTLPATEIARLEQRLRTEPAFRRALLRRANLDAGLREWATGLGAEAAWVTPPRPPVTRHTTAWLVAALSLAAAVVLAVVRWQRPPKPEAARPSEQIAVGCAILTEAVGADWSSTKRTLRLGETINAGTLALQRGLAQIEFFSGATLVLEGPAEIAINSPWEVVCHHGKARVRVPPAAHGFRLLTPGMTIVDLGTEFAAEVDRGRQGARVQVFDGEIEARTAAAPAPISLRRGEGLALVGTTVERFAAGESDGFVTADRLNRLSREHAQARLAAWIRFSAQQRQDARLIAYYPMTRSDGWARLVRNSALPGNPDRDGGAVGAVWSEGRWPEKSALEFKRPGDRVRLHIEGTYEAITLAGWVRVDGLDRRYNALLLTDGYDPGEPHWQIYEDGRLMFSVTYEDPENPGKRRNQIYYSPIIFDRTNTGRWHHVAVTYENRSGAAVQYVDGVEVSREVHPFHAPGRPISFGTCELGNWGIPLTGHQFPIRNFNGRIDEFAIYSAALDGEEIHAMFEAGRQE